jgi:hypothetical protein
MSETHNGRVQRERFNIYVIRLWPEVLLKKASSDKNPQHDPRKPSVYVGMTSRTPEERLARRLRRCGYAVWQS